MHHASTFTSGITASVKQDKFKRWAFAFQIPLSVYLFRTLSLIQTSLCVWPPSLQHPTRPNTSVCSACVTRRRFYGRTTTLYIICKILTSILFYISIKYMSKIYLVFGDKCFMFVLARPLEHTFIYNHLIVYL